MAQLISLTTHADSRGKLTVLEKVLPFVIKRLYWIYDVEGKRGGHRHIETYQALLVLSGSAKVYCNNGKKEETFILDAKNQCLLLPPEDWHTMDEFSPGTVLMVLASKEYDPKDYIHEPY